MHKGRGTCGRTRSISCLHFSPSAASHASAWSYAPLGGGEQAIATPHGCCIDRGSSVRAAPLAFSNKSANLVCTAFKPL